MKNILIKTKKRRNNVSKEYLQRELQKQLSNDGIFFIKIDSENIEILINNEDLNSLINKILEFKLNDNFYLNQEKIVIQEIKLLDKENEKKFKIKENRVTIIFKTPAIFKVGYNFLDFSFQLLFLLSSKKYNKFFKDKKIELNKKELEKIKLIKEHIEKGELNSFIGEIKLDFSNISDDEKENYELLLYFMKLNGIGYKYKKYYGVIEII
jgi:hypothetical protein